jgi:hypothetical protein
LLAVVGLLFSAGPSLACPSCFGEAQGPLIDAARLGIWFLLAVTVGLQGGFALFFLYLRRRAARAAGQTTDEEWARYQAQRALRGRERT